MAKNKLGQEAIQKKGWLRSHKWLILRRISQISIMALFFFSMQFGLDFIKGSMVSSLVLNTIPLSDPFVVSQFLLAAKELSSEALIGAGVVILFYMIVGGRVYCSWVCPVNIITDSAEWLRKRLGLKSAMHLSPKTRYALLVLSLVLPLVTGTVVWELVNPVTFISRSIVFGSTMAWVVVAAIFMLDLLVSKRAWCSHLCPMGAFYSLLNHNSLVRVNADKRDKCDDCAECYSVCPEPLILRPVLKRNSGAGTVVLSESCTNCGRCIDICAEDVFSMGSRFRPIPTVNAIHIKEVSS